MFHTIFKNAFARAIWRCFFNKKIYGTIENCSFRRMRWLEFIVDVSGARMIAAKLVFFFCIYSLILIEFECINSERSRVRTSSKAYYWTAFVAKWLRRSLSIFFFFAAWRIICIILFEFIERNVLDMMGIIDNVFKTSWSSLISFHLISSKTSSSRTKGKPIHELNPYRDQDHHHPFPSHPYSFTNSSFVLYVLMFNRKSVTEIVKGINYVWPKNDEREMSERDFQSAEIERSPICYHSLSSHTNKQTLT